MKKNPTKGFTLVELIVASGMFLAATLIIVGAVLSLEAASRKARATRIAFDNVGAAMDSLSRSIRMGSRFHCGTFTAASIQNPADCEMSRSGVVINGGENIFAFERQGGDTSNANDQYVYRLNAERIERSTNSGLSYVALTAPEIRITTLRFWVGGTAIGNEQPYVTMLVRGVASTSAKTFTSFNIQTTVSQRTPNFF